MLYGLEAVALKKMQRLSGMITTNDLVIANKVVLGTVTVNVR